MFLRPDLYLSSYTTGKLMGWVSIYLGWLMCIEQGMVTWPNICHPSYLAAGSLNMRPTALSYPCLPAPWAKILVQTARISE